MSETVSNKIELFIDLSQFDAMMKTLAQRNLDPVLFESFNSLQKEMDKIGTELLVDEWPFDEDKHKRYLSLRKQLDNMLKEHNITCK